MMGAASADASRAASLEATMRSYEVVIVPFFPNSRKPKGRLQPPKRSSEPSPWPLKPCGSKHSPDQPPIILSRLFYEPGDRVAK
jgi:hypothetical protein